MRDHFTTTEPIAVSELMLDVENPRTGVLESQTESIKIMLLGNSAKKIVNLAEHIAANGLGLNPIVIFKNSQGNLVVKDGNRRAAALKLLNNPALAPDNIFKSRFTTIREQAKNAIPDKVVCLESKTIEMAYKHMDLEHGGEQEGVGHVDWGTYEKGNFAELIGGKPSEVIGRAIRKLLTDDNFSEAQQAPITNITRLFSSQATQQRLGIRWISKTNSFEFDSPTEKVMPIIKAIVSEFASRSKNVNDIYHEEDREKYLNDFFERWNAIQGNKIDNVSDDKQSPGGSGSDNTPPDGQDRDALPPVHGPSRPPRQRHKVIRRGASLPVPVSEIKLRSILYELEKELKVTDTPVASAVLVRLILERTVDAYVEKRKIQIPKDHESQSLNGKIIKVIDNLTSRKLLTGQEAQERKRLAKNEEFISAKTLQSWVHSKTETPSSEAVCTWWDNNYLFLRKCWENME